MAFILCRSSRAGFQGNISARRKIDHRDVDRIGRATVNWRTAYQIAMTICYVARSLRLVQLILAFRGEQRATTLHRMAGRVSFGRESVTHAA
jgi:hypothetical protein